MPVRIYHDHEERPRKYFFFEVPKDIEPCHGCNMKPGIFKLTLRVKPEGYADHEDTFIGLFCNDCFFKYVEKEIDSAVACGEKFKMFSHTREMA